MLVYNIETSSDSCAEIQEINVVVNKVRPLLTLFFYLQEFIMKKICSIQVSAKLDGTGVVLTFI